MSCNTCLLYGILIATFLYITCLPHLPQEVPVRWLNYKHTAQIFLGRKGAGNSKRWNYRRTTSQRRATDWTAVRKRSEKNIDLVCAVLHTKDCFVFDLSHFPLKYTLGNYRVWSAILNFILRQATQYNRLFRSAPNFCEHLFFSVSGIRRSTLLQRGPWKAATADQVTRRFGLVFYSYFTNLLSFLTILPQLDC